MSTPAVFLRRARMRGLKEGQVQTVRVEALENDAKDNAERFQDYGLAANPVDGQGLVITVGGHVIVLRMDRLVERPHLAPYEVSVWHKEGHAVTLRDGKVVEVSCDSFIVNAATSVQLNSPTVAMSGAATVVGRVDAGGVTAAGKQLDGHDHNDLTSGGKTGLNN